MEKNMIIKKCDHLYKFCNYFAEIEWTGDVYLHVKGSVFHVRWHNIHQIPKWIIISAHTFSNTWCIVTMTASTVNWKQEWGKINMK